MECKETTSLESYFLSLANFSHDRAREVITIVWTFFGFFVSLFRQICADVKSHIALVCSFHMLLDGQILLSLYFQRTRNLRWWRRRQACLVSPSATWLWLRSSTWDSHSYRWSWWWWWGRWWWWWWWRRQCKGPPSSIFAANGIDDRDCCDHDILWSNADLWLREILKWMNKIIQNGKWKYLSLERVCFQWERSQHLEQFTRYFDFRLQEDRKCRKEQNFYFHHGFF